MPQKFVPQVQREWSDLIAPQVNPMPYPFACLIQSASWPIRTGTAEEEPYGVPGVIAPQPQRDPSERSARTPMAPQERLVQRTLLSPAEGARMETEGDPPLDCAGGEIAWKDEVDVDEEQEARRSARDAATPTGNRWTGIIWPHLRWAG